MTETDRIGQREGEAETEPQQRERDKEAQNNRGQAASGSERYSSRQLHIFTGEMSRGSSDCARGDCSPLYPAAIF